VVIIHCTSRGPLYVYLIYSSWRRRKIKTTEEKKEIRRLIKLMR
jgi:hypothetical protein